MTVGEEGNRASRLRVDGVYLTDAELGMFSSDRCEFRGSILEFTVSGGGSRSVLGTMVLVIGLLYNCCFAVRGVSCVSTSAF